MLWVMPSVMEKKKRLFCIAKLLEITGVFTEWSTSEKRLLFQETLSRLKKFY